MASILAEVFGYSAVALSILAVLLNLVVMVVLAATSHLRINYFAFVFNLALADLGFAVTAIAFLLSGSRVLSALFQLCAFVGMLTICAVAVHRYLSFVISPPARFDSMVTRCRLLTACLLIWAFSGALLLPIFFAASGETRLILSAWLRAPLVLLVWIVTAALYAYVFHKIRSYVTSTESCSPVVRTDDAQQAPARVRQTRRLLVTFSIILVSSFVCWMPYNIGQIIDYFIETGQSPISEDTLETYNWVAGFVFCLSAVINPLVYWWRLDGFRQAFIALFCRCLRQDREESEGSVDCREYQQNTEIVL